LGAWLIIRPRAVLATVLGHVGPHRLAEHLGRIAAIADARCVDARWTGRALTERPASSGDQLSALVVRPPRAEHSKTILPQPPVGCPFESGQSLAVVNEGGIRWDR
jgi:hypothetical protein